LKQLHIFQKSFLTTLCALILSSAYSQTTFWSEDFNGYSDGVTTGSNNNTNNPANDWTSGGCTTCPSSIDDWWEIRSGVMEARDVNNEHVYLQTESIDISAYNSVIINVDVIENGDLEGLYWGADNCSDATNQDYADVEYRVNGGTWTLVPNYLGWCGLYASCAVHTLYGDDSVSGDCASEINNNYFIIERSTNAITWEKVKDITGSGNSNTIKSYAFTDPNPYPGVSYYRLKQTDFDGQIDSSQIKSVRVEKLKKETVNLFPNPVKNQITIEGSDAELKDIRIYNMLGQDVTYSTHQAVNNETTVVINLSKLNPGIYYIYTKNTAHKLLKQ